MTKSLLSDQEQTEASKVSVHTSSISNTLACPHQDNNPSQARASPSLAAVVDSPSSDLRDLGLRPKFAAFRHTTETLNQTTVYHQNSKRTSPPPSVTPAWFFNIPNVRTPFLDFSRNLCDDE